MEYMDMLYNEYLKTLNSIPDKEKYLKEQFKYWLEEKSRILPLYEQFLQSLDLTPSKGIIEIDKCEYDSVLPYTPIGTKGLLVSNNVKTKILNNSNIININGKLVMSDNKININYQKKTIDVSDNKNFITQFPFDENTKLLMIRLMDTDKNVFIGLYGKLKDKNRLDNLKYLYDLKQEINKYTNKNIEGEVTYTKEFYLAAITPKLKYKQKSK